MSDEIKSTETTETTETPQQVIKESPPLIIDDSIYEPLPILVTDKRDGLNCRVLKFYPNCNKILVWKDMLPNVVYQSREHHEECFGLHVNYVEGAEQTLRKVGVWDQMTDASKKEFLKIQEKAMAARSEAIRLGHEKRRNRKRSEWTPEQIKEEKIKLKLKEMMDEKYPNRGRGNCNKEIRDYRKSILKHITEDIENEMNTKTKENFD